MVGTDKMSVSGEFGILVANVCGWTDAGVVVAAARCGAGGVLNCENLRDRAATERALARVIRLTNRPFGLKLDASFENASDLLRQLPQQVEFVVLTGAEQSELARMVQAARTGRRRVLLEVTSSEQARRGQSLEVDGFIAKG